MSSSVLSDGNWWKSISSTVQGIPSEVFTTDCNLVTSCASGRAGGGYFRRGSEFREEQFRGRQLSNDSVLTERTCVLFHPIEMHCYAGNKAINPD